MTPADPVDGGDRKAAIRRAQEVAGNYRKRANTADPTSRSFDRLRMASDHATADLLEHLASLLSLTPTQPDREQIAAAVQSITDGWISPESDAEIVDAVMAFFNGGTKP